MVGDAVAYLGSEPAPDGGYGKFRCMVVETFRFTENPGSKPRRCTNVCMDVICIAGYIFEAPEAQKSKNPYHFGGRSTMQSPDALMHQFVNRELCIGQH